MKHDKLVFIRIICLVGIIGEVLFPNSTGGILFGLILAITSVIFLLMLKNEMALEKSDCENNYSISIMCIPQFHTYRGEIEFEGTLIQADIFIDNKMLEDKNSFLISFLCKSNTIYKMVCRNVLKKEGYYINLKFNGVKLKTRVLSVSQSFIDSNSETYRIGLMCSNDLSI